MLIIQMRKNTDPNKIDITIQSGVPNRYTEIAQFTVDSVAPFGTEMPFNIRQKTWRQVYLPMMSNVDEVTSITINDAINASMECIAVWITIETLTRDLQLLPEEVSALHNGGKLIKLIKEERLLVGKRNASDYDRNSTSQMLEAIRQNNLQTVVSSLSNNADPNANESVLLRWRSPMPLYSAIDSGLDMVRILVENGARVNAVSSQTPLYRAAECGKLDIVQYLVSQNADVDYMGTNLKGLALWVAIQNDHKDIAKYLLAKTSQHIRAQLVKETKNEEYKALIEHSITQQSVPSIPVISGVTDDVAIHRIVTPIKKISSLLSGHDISEALYELMHVKNLLFNLSPEKKEIIILNFMSCLEGSSTANFSADLKNELFSCLKLMVLSNLKRTKSFVQFNETREKIISPILKHKCIIVTKISEQLKSRAIDCKDIFFGYKHIYELSVCEIYLNIQLDYIDNPSMFSSVIKVNLSEVVDQLFKVAAGNPVAAIWLITLGAARLIEIGYRITEDKLNAVVAAIEMYNNVVIYSSSLDEETALKILADTQAIFEGYSKNIILERSWLIFYGCIDVLINLSFRTFPNGGYELKSRILSFLTRKVPFEAEGIYANAAVVGKEFKLRIDAKIIEAICILSRNTEVQKEAIECLRALLSYREYSAGEGSLTVFAPFLAAVNSGRTLEEISNNLCENVPNALYQNKIWPSLCKEMLEQILILRPSILAEIKNVKSMSGLTEDQQVEDTLKRFLNPEGEVREKIMSKITYFCRGLPPEHLESYKKMFSRYLVTVSATPLQRVSHQISESYNVNSYQAENVEDYQGPEIAPEYSGEILIKDERAEESIRKILALIASATNLDMAAESKDLAILLGTTGVGKSTYVNFLMDCEMELAESNNGTNVVRVKPESHGVEVAGIGHDLASHTAVLKSYRIPGTDINICDTPGFLDTRLAEQNIANAVNLRKGLSYAKSVRFIVLIGYSDFLQARGLNLGETIKILKQVFGSALSNYGQSILVGITQLPETYGGRFRDFAALQKFLSSTAAENGWPLEIDRIVPLSPMPKEHQALSKEAFLQEVDKLSPVIQKDNLYRTVLDNNSINLLNSVSKEILRQIEWYLKIENLRMENVDFAIERFNQLKSLQCIEHPQIDEDIRKAQEYIIALVGHLKQDVMTLFTGTRQQRQLFKAKMSELEQACIKLDICCAPLSTRSIYQALQQEIVTREVNLQQQANASIESEINFYINTLKERLNAMLSNSSDIVCSIDMTKRGINLLDEISGKTNIHDAHKLKEFFKQIDKEIAVRPVKYYMPDTEVLITLRRNKLFEIDQAVHLVFLSAKLAVLWGRFENHWNNLIQHKIIWLQNDEDSNILCSSNPLLLTTLDRVKFDSKPLGEIRAELQRLGSAEGVQSYDRQIKEFLDKLREDAIIKRKETVKHKIKADLLELTKYVEEPQKYCDLSRLITRLNNELTSMSILDGAQGDIFTALKNEVTDFFTVKVPAMLYAVPSPPDNKNYIANLKKLLDTIKLIVSLPSCFPEQGKTIIKDVENSIEAREKERMKNRYGDFADKFATAKIAINDQLNKGFSQPIYNLNLDLSKPEDCLMKLSEKIDSVKLYYHAYAALSEDISYHSIRYKFVDINVFINEKSNQLNAIRLFLGDVVKKVLDQKKADEISLEIANILDGSLVSSKVEQLNMHFRELESLDEQRFLSCVCIAEKKLIIDPMEQLTNILRAMPENYTSILSKIFDKMDCAIKLTSCFKEIAMAGIKAQIEKNKDRVKEHENSRHMQKNKDLTDRLDTRFGETKLAINQYNIENYSEIAKLALNRHDARISLKMLVKHIPVVNQYLSTLNDLKESIDKHPQQYYFIKESNLVNLAELEYQRLKKFFDEVSQEVLKKSLLQQFHDNLHLLNKNLTDYVKDINNSEKIWRNSPLTLGKLRTLNYSISVIADIESALEQLKSGHHEISQTINRKLDDFFKKMQVCAISEIIRDIWVNETYSSNKNEMCLYLDKLQELDPTDIYKKSIADLQANINKYGGERKVTPLIGSSDYNQLNTINQVLISYSKSISKHINIKVNLATFEALIKSHIKDLITDSRQEISDNLSLNQALERGRINNITAISKTSLDAYSGYPAGNLVTIFRQEVVRALQEALGKISADIFKVKEGNQEKLILSFTLAMIKSYEMGRILGNLNDVRPVMHHYLSQLIKSNGERIRSGYTFVLVEELPGQNAADKNTLYITMSGKYAVFDSRDEFREDVFGESEIDLIGIPQKILTAEFQYAVLNITSRRGHTQKNNMEQILSKAMLEQLDNKNFAETVKALISEFKAYQNLDIGLFNAKVCLRFEDALSKVKFEPSIGTASMERLRKINQVYEATYAEYINKFIRGNFNENELHGHIIRLQASLKSLFFQSPHSEATIQHAGQLLACICALWSYIGADKVWPGERKNLLQPHSTQLLAIFSLLGFDEGEKSNNRLCEILTGQGKSVALAIISSFYALLDHEVDVVCYSPYLSERDQKQFNLLFKALKLGDTKVSYCTIDELANLTMKRYLPDLRPLVDNFLRGKEVALIAEPNSKRILLIDEVDVFFGENFYGHCYNPVVTLKSSAVDIFELLWRLWANQGATLLPSLDEITVQVRNLECSKALLMKYPKYNELFDATIREIFKDLSSAFPYRDGVKIAHQCICENNKIGYLDNKTGHINFNTRHGYKTAFAYLYYAEQGKIVRDTNFEDQLSIHVACGHVLYSSLPTFYSKILGVTGTLQSLSPTENQILSDYHFGNKTFIPSAFRRDNSNALDLQSTMVCNDYNEYFYAIKSDIEIKIKEKRAVLVVFETYELLEIFRIRLGEIPINATYALEILTERCNEAERDAAVTRAISKATITLMTRTYGRGTDFVCRDEYLICNKGVHVIMTFAPESQVEETQIYGRTCRQDNPGSVRKFLCAEHLVTQGFLSSVPYMGNSRTLDPPNLQGEQKSWDDFIKDKRHSLDERRYAAIQRNLNYNTIRHENTLLMAREIGLKNDARVMEILKHEFNPPPLGASEQSSKLQRRSSFSRKYI